LLRDSTASKTTGELLWIHKMGRAAQVERSDIQQADHRSAAWI
jgi:hypothetical protein